MHSAHKVESANRDRGAVVTYAAADRAHRHDAVTQAAIAARLAALKGYHFAGEFDPADRPTGRVYFVPGATLVGVAVANALGVRTEDDLFGGVVPHPLCRHQGHHPPARRRPGGLPRRRCPDCRAGLSLLPRRTGAGSLPALSSRTAFVSKYPAAVRLHSPESGAAGC
jgi:hypothetical protein